MSEGPRNPQLFVRDGDRILDAPAEDTAVASQYPQWPGKGVIVDGRRITIMAAQRNYRVGEEIRVIHVYEVIDARHRLFVSGPKRVKGEYVNGVLASDEEDRTGQSVEPSDYDGRVVPGPGVDFNFEITRYELSTPETLRIEWRVGPLASNTLSVDVAQSR